MTKTNKNNNSPMTPTEAMTAKERRALLKKLGRFAAVTAPTVTLLLAARIKPGNAQPVSCAPKSSRALKIAEGGVDAAGALVGVVSLPIREWRDKSETGLGQQTQIGPSAEDFRAALGVGDGVTISSIDAIGICLAAIRALADKVEGLEAELQAAHWKKAA